jgi:hypothetical protein
MANNMKMVSFTGPTDYGVEQERIARNRKLAEALYADANTPLEMPQHPSVRISPFAGLAKMLKAYNARKATEFADQETKDLAGRVTANRNSALASAMRAMQGAPATSETIVDEQAAGGEGQLATINAPAVPGSRSRAMEILATSGDPSLSQIPMQSMLAEMLKQPKWEVKERFNEKTGRQEKVLVDLNNPANVQPFGGQEATKLEFVNQGGDIQPRDPFTGLPSGAPIPRTVGPEFNSISAADRQRLANDSSRLGMEGQRLWWETGQAPRMGGSNMGAPAVPAPAAPAAPAVPGGAGPIPASFSAPTVAGAPAAPPAVSPAPNLPPRAAAQVAADVEKNRLELQNKRDFNMGGINDVLTEAESILNGAAGPVADGKRGATPLPTQSTTGAIADWTASLVGRAPDGAAQADQLKALAGALTAKMPRMEGPQSDKDVMMYREMAGQIGDNTLPISRRLAALDTVRRIVAKHERGQTQTPAAPAPAAPRPRARNPQTGQEVEWDGSKWVPVSLSVEAEQPQMQLGA